MRIPFGTSTGQHPSNWLTGSISFTWPSSTRERSSTWQTSRSPFFSGAEHPLEWITVATEDSITVDFTEWHDEQEFPGPEDPDPGVLTTLPVADQVRVIVSNQVDVGYEWFHAEARAGHTNVPGLPGLDDWNPNGVYPYTLTIHNGEVVQIWKVPLG
jgi:hypothetical protein